MAPAADWIGEPAAVGDNGRAAKNRTSLERGRPHRSRQAQQIHAALQTVDGFLSAQDLYAQLRRDGQPVGLSTVYRCLRDLLGGGAVDLVVSETGEALYRRRDLAGDQAGEHHHYLVCRVCGAAVEIDSSTIEQRLTSIGQDNGFDRLEHRVEIFGRCPRCCAGARDAGGGVRRG